MKTPIPALGIATAPETTPTSESSATGPRVAGRARRRAGSKGRTVDRSGQGVLPAGSARSSRPVVSPVTAAWCTEVGMWWPLTRLRKAQ